MSVSLYASSAAGGITSNLSKAHVTRAS